MMGRLINGWLSDHPKVSVVAIVSQRRNNKFHVFNQNKGQRSSSQ